MKILCNDLQGTHGFPESIVGKVAVSVVKALEYLRDEHVNCLTDWLDLLATFTFPGLDASGREAFEYFIGQRSDQTLRLWHFGKTERVECTDNKHWLLHLFGGDLTNSNHKIECLLSIPNG